MYDIQGVLLCEEVRVSHFTYNLWFQKNWVETWVSGDAISF